MYIYIHLYLHQSHFIYNYIHIILIYEMNMHVHVHDKYTFYAVHTSTSNTHFTLFKLYTGVYSFPSFLRRLDVDKSPLEYVSQSRKILA